jgi:hypothetical protein
VLVVKLDANGNVQAQRGFNNLDRTHTPIAAEHAQVIVQTADGGYLVGGNWTNNSGQGPCCSGALLLKLRSDLSVEWQYAYGVGSSCSTSTCTNDGGVIYSVQQNADGSYLLDGSGFFRPIKGTTQLVPWMGKVTESGEPLWQHYYFQTNPNTGRPVSEYFASSAFNAAEGLLGLGWTEDKTTLLGRLYTVMTDSSGLAGACEDVHNSAPWIAISPVLTNIKLAMPVATMVSPGAPSAARTVPTSANVETEC